MFGCRLCSRLLALSISSNYQGPSENLKLFLVLFGKWNTAKTPQQNEQQRHGQTTFCLLELIYPPNCRHNRRVVGIPTCVELGFHCNEYATGLEAHLHENIGFSPKMCSCNRGDLMASVLIVDDHELIRNMLRVIFEAAGHTILEAQDAPEALEVCRNRKGPIDVLLCDLVIPGMTVRELVPEVLGLRPAIRVIIMSGHGEDTVRATGVSGAFPVLCKPFEMSEAVRLVERGNDEFDRRPRG